jgi:regulator of RNase E activity RraA
MKVSINDTPALSLPAGVLDRWRKVPVSVIVDLDKGLRQIDPSIRLLQARARGNDDSQPILFGRAVTARCEPPDFGAVMYAMDVVGKDDVLVIAANGSAGHAMIGDILGGHLRAKGAAGVVCDGAVRDTANLAGWSDLPVYCASINARGPVGAERGAVNETVTIAGCEVRPGDLVIGDADGLVVLSEADMQTWIDAAEARLVTEADWARRLGSGETAQSVFGLK